MPSLSALAAGCNDYGTKPQETKRLRDLKVAQQRKLHELNAALELRNRFIRQTFGSYLSDEIVDAILEKGGLKIGGEKRRATILMADLR